MLTAASIEVNGVKALSNTERTVEVCNRERRIWCSLVEIFSSVIGWSDFVACEFDYWIGDDCDIVNISQFSIIKSCEFHIEIWD